MKYTCTCKNMKREKKINKQSGRVATTADTNYCGPRLKRKTNIIKTMYTRLKTATDIGGKTAR